MDTKTKQLAPVITDQYAIYNDDCIEVLSKLPKESVHLSIYSPPFQGLYVYSSSERDLSNCRTPQEFFQHYEFVVNEIFRLTLPGRITAVHCMDVPSGNCGVDHLTDFPGDIIRLHEKIGFNYIARHCIHKEPLAVRNRTMAKKLTHSSVVADSSHSSAASADYLLIFRKRGTNPIPIAHPNGLLEYVGSTPIPSELLRYKGWKGNQIENRYSHWIWRQYASSIWEDIREKRVLPYKLARDAEDEKHVHALQLDVIERCVQFYSLEGETVLTPFLGVGSEVYGAVRNGRRGIGIELKPTYYRQACLNVAQALLDRDTVEEQSLFDLTETDDVSAEDAEELALADDRWKY